MKKTVCLVLCMLLVFSAVFAQGQQEAAGEKTFTLKLGHASTTESTRHKALLVMEEYVEKESDGRLQIEIYPAGTLGNESDMIEAMKLGTQEMFVGGVFASQTPKLEIFLMPFFFPTQADLMKVSRSDFGAEIMATAEEYGIKMLAVGDGGSRQITNNTRPIKTPADMKGLKIRTPPIESIIKSMEALGANPVSIPYGDTYMALKTGVADGQENPLANIGDMKFFEVQKFMTMIDYQFHPEPFDVNLDVWNSLPSDLQEVLQAGAWIYTDEQNKLRRELNEYYYDMIVDGGVTVYSPTDAEIQKFIDACQPVYSYFVDKGIFTQAELDEMRRIVNET
ncbi:TRAP transporter substrate-binding protein [uncultured Sphaerochaeta sp.]|uniref:TRAP transporter substrate-binding protein n=1 Tax=uncultured Sphaerochaeta sp. TaxID=886478 RepID=UPI002A0A70F7|nr:TRAP transporter substrate-binding protein [uncultured Sphaerochaeta sp.]